MATVSRQNRKGLQYERMVDIINSGCLGPAPGICIAQAGDLHLNEPCKLSVGQQKSYQ